MLLPIPGTRAANEAVSKSAAREAARQMALVAYRHGLRSSELVGLRWDQIDFETASLHVRRVKKGTPSTHPILGDELRALRRLQREQEPKSPFVFTSERGAPFTTAGFARMVERAGSEAKLGFKAHPHMLRHACGYALANRGHDTRALQAYLGHRNIQHGALFRIGPDAVQGFLALVGLPDFDLLNRASISLDRFIVSAKSYRLQFPPCNESLRSEAMWVASAVTCEFLFERKNCDDDGPDTKLATMASFLKVAVASEGLKPLGEVIGHREGLDVRFELAMSAVMVALNGSRAKRESG